MENEEALGFMGAISRLRSVTVASLNGQSDAEIQRDAYDAIMAPIRRRISRHNNTVVPRANIAEPAAGAEAEGAPRAAVVAGHFAETVSSEEFQDMHAMKQLRYLLNEGVRVELKYEPGDGHYYIIAVEGPLVGQVLRKAHTLGGAVGAVALECKGIVQGSGGKDEKR